MRAFEFSIWLFALPALAAAPRSRADGGSDLDQLIGDTIERTMEETREQVEHAREQLQAAMNQLLQDLRIKLQLLIHSDTSQCFAPQSEQASRFIDRVMGLDGGIEYSLRTNRSDALLDRVRELGR